MVSISKPKFTGVCGILIMLGLFVNAVSASFSYTQSLPSNTIYFDDFGNYVTPSPCITAALSCLPGWGAFDNATGGIANITTWHPLTSSGKSMLMGSSSSPAGKFDRHRSWAQLPGQTRLTASQWFQISQTSKQGTFTPNNNEIHFSLEMVDSVGNFHECVMEIFTTASKPYFDEYVGINDQVFNYNMSVRAFDAGGFSTNPDGLWANHQWHYEKITMDITNPLAPTCIWMQIDSIVFNNLTGLAGWTTTFSNKVAWAGTGSVATSHASGDFTSGQVGTLPWRLEIAMITGSVTTQYFTWHTNILITDDSVVPTQSFFAANELWKAVAAMGSMMSVVTMFSSVRAYQEPDPLRRRMKLMVAVVFAVGAGTLAVFAIILSRL